MEFKVYSKQKGEFVRLNRISNTVYENENITATVEITEKDGVSGVYVSAKSKYELSDTSAVRLVISEIIGLESYVSGSSTYTDYNCWYAPVFGNDLTKVAPITQSFMWKASDGFGCVLCSCDSKYKSEMCGCDDGLAIDVFDNNSGEYEIPRSLICLIAKGQNPFELNDACVKLGMELLGKAVGGRGDRPYPEIFEYLGWCSWDAFQIRVSEENLLNKCEEFKKKNIPVRWAILDDMWADCTDLDNAKYSSFDEMMKIMKASKLNAFEASPKRFENGLRHTIEKMNEYGIRVGMWHPTTGYWKGINPESKLFEDYYDCLVENTDGWYQPSFENGRFYEDFYAFLKECGCEFLKVDNQSSFHFNRNMAPIGQLAAGLHKNIEGAAKKYFDNTIINCMGLAVENMWSRPESAVIRCSDDFKPEDKAWFKKHILQCTFCCMFIGAIMWCDYDMWWTDDNQAGKNSLLRAVSGGPIYVSDTMDRSKKEVLDPLVFGDGKILRCDRPGIPTADCLFENPTKGHKIFKVQNICGDCGVIAVYNLTDGKASGTVSASDVNGLCDDGCIIYEHFSGEYTVLDKGEKIDVTLKDDEEYRLFVIVPKREVSFIGLTDKLISPKGITENRDTKIKLYEPGRCAFWTDKPIDAVICGDKKCEFTKKGEFYSFDADACEIEVIISGTQK